MKTKLLVPLTVTVALMLSGCLGTYTMTTTDFKQVARHGSIDVAELRILNESYCDVRLDPPPLPADTLRPGEAVTLRYSVPIRTGRSHRATLMVTPLECEGRDELPAGTTRVFTFNESRNRGLNAYGWLIKATRSNLRFQGG